MKKTKFYIIPILLLIIFSSCTSTSHLEEESMATQSPTKKVVNPPINSAIPASVVVNIEGTIKEVSKDGKSFMLNNGKWIITDKHTEMGISGLNAAPKDEQYFEPSFRVGNSIAGFTEYPKGELLVAQVIYTNWNWDNPVE